MKKQKAFWAWVMVIGLFFGITLITGQALAAGTMGEVINELAALLNMPAADLATILYPGGFNAAAPATEGNISQLYLALNNAVIGGQLSGNATTLIADAAGKAGVPKDVVSDGITSGVSLTSRAGTRGGEGGAGGVYGGATGATGGGGGGGAISQSR